MTEVLSGLWLRRFKRLETQQPFSSSVRGNATVPNTIEVWATFNVHATPLSYPDPNYSAVCWMAARGLPNATQLQLNLCRDIHISNGPNQETRPDKKIPLVPLLGRNDDHGNKHDLLSRSMPRGAMLSDQNSNPVP